MDGRRRGHHGLADPERDGSRAEEAEYYAGDDALILPFRAEAVMYLRLTGERSW